MTITFDAITLCAWIGCLLSILCLWTLTGHKRDLKAFSDIVSNDINNLRQTEEHLLKHVQKLGGEVGDVFMRQNDIENRLAAIEEQNNE